MIGARILPGDKLIVEQCPTAANGEIVVALVDDSATVKRFIRRTDITASSRRTMPWSLSSRKP